MVALVRAFGLHRPHETPCGEPVPVAEAHALMDLATVPSMNHGDLAKRLRLDKSTVSRLVRQLEKRKWIQRMSAPSDGRVLLIRLTPKGRRAAQRLAAARRSKFDRLLEAIPSKQRAEVMNALTTLVEAMDKNDRRARS